MNEFKNIFILLITIFQMTAISCGQESRRINTPKIGAAQKKTALPELLWKSSISEGATLSSIMPLIIHNGAILCDATGSEPDKGRLVMINIADGSLRWECVEMKNKYVSTSNPIYQYNNILLLRHGSQLYAINADNGTMRWKKVIPHGRGITLTDSIFYFGTSGFLWRGNIFYDTVDTVVSLKSIIPPPRLPANLPVSVCEPLQIASIINKNDTLLLFIYLIGNSNTNIFESYLMLYNINTKKTVYCTNIQAQFPDFGGKVEQYKGNLYITIGRTLACHNATTGKQLWKKDFKGTLMSAGMIIREGKVFLHSDEYPPQTYAIDPLTGKELWKTPSDGAIFGKLFYMDGIVYFTTAWLHAVDAKTGKELWSLECPGKKEKSYDSFFDDVIGIDGKIFVRSGFHLYCYKVSP